MPPTNIIVTDTSSVEDGAIVEHVVYDHKSFGTRIRSAWEVSVKNLAPIEGGSRIQWNCKVYNGNPRGVISHGTMMHISIEITAGSLPEEELDSGWSSENSYLPQWVRA